MTFFKKRVIVIEEENSLRGIFSLVVNSSPKFFLVNTHPTCGDAIKHLQRDQPDIVLMDISTARPDAIHGIRVIKSRKPHIDVMIVSDSDESDLVFDTLKAGASGFIAKSADYKELIAAVEEIGRGGAPMSSKVARMVISSFRINNNSPLTQRETEILRLIAQGKTYLQISYELFISKETSKNHIKNIYSKLNVSRKSEALARATSDRLI